MNYFAPGDHNFVCDLCGAIEKASKGVRTWDGFYVCAWHKEQRNPQDFVRGVREEQRVPWSRPEPEPTFILSCTLQGSNAIPNWAVPDCAYPNNINLAFLPSERL